jgi:hypothetical protein
VYIQRGKFYSVTNVTDVNLFLSVYLRTYFLSAMPPVSDP